MQSRPAELRIAAGSFNLLWDDKVVNEDLKIWVGGLAPETHTPDGQTISSLSFPVFVGGSKVSMFRIFPGGRGIRPSPKPWVSQGLAVHH
jgi:hypothetical protein